MEVQYADVTLFKEDYFTGNRLNYMSTNGYTKIGGCPTDLKVKTRGSNRWYRVYAFCTSNTETLFIKKRSQGEDGKYAFVVVRQSDLERIGVGCVEEHTVIKLMDD